jgi:uncharacterized ferredoxin-like protein
MDQQELIMEALRQVAKLCAISAITAPKSGGQLFLRGAKPFIETVIVEERVTLDRLATWLRERGKKLKAPIWFRDADAAEKMDLVLFIGLTKWYPPTYDCGACGYATCAEFLRAREHNKSADSEDWEFPGPVCQIRCIDLGVAMGSAAKTAAMNNVDARCQTRIAAAARHLGIIESDVAVALSMSVSHKNIFFDKPIPQINFDESV